MTSSVVLECDFEYGPLYSCLRALGAIFEANILGNNSKILIVFIVSNCEQALGEKTICTMPQM